MGRGSQEKILNQIFELKFTSKGLVRQAKKCEQEEKAEKLKVKKAMEKGNMDGARVYAQNAIRKHNEQLNYLRLASRLDAVVARLESQSKTQAIGHSMKGIVRALQDALTVGNMQRISQTMDLFEKAFSTAEVQSQFVESAMAGSTSLSTPEDEVGSLMQQVADSQGLEVSACLPSFTMPRTTAALPAASVASKASPSPAACVSEDELSRRLAELKNRGTL
ncbi:hypothetical protein KP509_23G038900 [Ceratopteris richardii]|uniref:Uncharacterized protein n=1 Tax=Ceratopteris richardii TaxID=49495 RepID=A0A8T2RYY0_CERRI|nr:hypothetical protein KP509_23G038900 [Ceratopteris richardii]